MAARKPTKLNAPATATAIQLGQNGTSTPFMMTDHPITIRSNWKSVIRAKMVAATVQKVLIVIECPYLGARLGRNKLAHSAFARSSVSSA